jgi:pyruvate carboxylase
MRGDLGQSPGGFPPEIQKMVLKDEKPYTEKPNEHLKPIDFEKEFMSFQKEFGDELDIRDLLSFLLYPKVYREFRQYVKEYGDVSKLPTAAFFFGLKPNEEINVAMDEGKNLLIKYLNKTPPDEQGIRMVTFALNGQYRTIPVKDKGADVPIIEHQKAKKEGEIGAPLQGNLSTVLVKVGDKVQVNSPLFIIEAMKMESTVTSTVEGEVIEIVLNPGTLVEQEDLIVRIKV